MSILKKVRRFYRASDENKVQAHEIIGFIAVPIVVMVLLYIVVILFWK